MNATHDRIGLLSALLATMILCGCREPIKRQQIIGTWDIVAATHSPMGEVVVPNDVITGWISFHKNLLYEAEILPKDAEKVIKRSGEYTITDGVLVTVSRGGSKRGRLEFYGDCLVTISDPKPGKQPLYTYYKRRVKIAGDEKQ